MYFQGNINKHTNVEQELFKDYSNYFEYCDYCLSC